MPAHYEFHPTHPSPPMRDESFDCARSFTGSTFAKTTKSTLFSRFPLNESMRRSRSTPAPVVEELAVTQVARSNSALSWFSEDESDEGPSRRSWRFSTRRKKGPAPSTSPLVRSPPLSPCLAPSASSSTLIEIPSPPVPSHQLQLALDLGFDCPFPDDTAGRPAPRVDTIPPPAHTRRSSSDIARHRSRTRSYAASSWVSSVARSSAASLRPASDGDWADSYSLSSPRLGFSPDMTELDEEPYWEPRPAKITYEGDSALLAFLRDDIPAPTSAPTSPSLNRKPLPPLPPPSPPRRLSDRPSTESLVAGFSSSSPTSIPMSRSRAAFGLDFPLPPPSPLSSPPTSPLPPRPTHQRQNLSVHFVEGFLSGMRNV